MFLFAFIKKRDYNHKQFSYIGGVYISGAALGVSSYVNRCVGYIFDNNTVSVSGASSITVNGSTVTSSNPASSNGLDVSSSDLTLQATYTDRSFNFTDEAQDYIWYMDGGVAGFRAGTL